MQTEVEGPGGRGQLVAARRHPLLDRAASLDDLVRCPWVDYDAPADIAPHDPRPSLPRLLAELHQRTLTHVRTVVRTGSRRCTRARWGRPASNS